VIVAVVRTLLLFERRRLERCLRQPFDQVRSSRLDAVIAALEALS